MVIFDDKGVGIWIGKGTQRLEVVSVIIPNVNGACMGVSKENFTGWSSHRQRRLYSMQCGAEIDFHSTETNGRRILPEKVPEDISGRLVNVTRPSVFAN